MKTKHFSLFALCSLLTSTMSKHGTLLSSLQSSMMATLVYIVERTHVRRASNNKIVTGKKTTNYEMKKKNDEHVITINCYLHKSLNRFIHRFSWNDSYVWNWFWCAVAALVAATLHRQQSMRTQENTWSSLSSPFDRYDFVCKSFTNDSIPCDLRLFIVRTNENKIDIDFNGRYRIMSLCWRIPHNDRQCV